MTIDFEKIAAQIHEFYRQQAIKGDWDVPVPYPELAEFMKSDNRAAARRIGQVLSLVGLRLVPNDGTPWPLTDQAGILDLIEDNDNIDLLGEGEHEGWTEARLRNGWRLGLCKDVAKRESHLLAPWSQFKEKIQIKRDHLAKLGQPPKDILEEEVKTELNKDRDSVRNYVQIIAGTDYRIVEEVR